MPSSSSRRTARIPRTIIPGRPVDWQLGASTPDLDTLEKLIRELQERNGAIGNFNIPGGPSEDDVMVFSGGSWTFVNKSTLLELTDLTDVVITSPLTGDVLTYSAGQWVNAPITEFLSLDDLSDVSVAAPAEGDFIVLNALGEWQNRQWTPGVFGIGASPTNGVFEITEPEVATWFTEDTAPDSGLRGWWIDKRDATEATPHGIVFSVEGDPIFDIGMDFNTTADGMSYLAILDHTANAGAGADIVAISPEFQSSISATCKFNIGRTAGPPEDQPDFITLNGGDDATALGGLRINYWANSTSRHALHLMNRHGTSRRAGINFDDLWVLQTDPDADGGQELAMSTGGVVHWTILGPGQVAQFYRDAGTTNAPYAYRLGHTSSGTAAAGFGVGMHFWAQDTTGTPVEIEMATIQSVMTTAAAGATNCAGYLSFGTRQLASGVLEALRLKPTGETTVRFDLKHEGTRLGFFNVATVTRAAAYTPTNVTTDRSYDANATTLDEVADVLGTLIADLQAYGLLQ